MAFQPVANTVAVLVRGNLLGEQVQNTLYVSPDPNGTGDSSVENAVESVGNGYVDNVLPQLTSAFTVTEVYGYGLDTIDSEAHTWQPAPGTEAGGGSGNSLPGNVTVFVSFKGARRNFRGGVYLPGIPETQVSGNTIAASYRDALVQAFDSLYTFVFNAGFLHVMVKRRDGGVELPAGVTEFVTQYKVDQRLDSQRRRLAGRGS